MLTSGDVIFPTCKLTNKCEMATQDLGCCICYGTIGRKDDSLEQKHTIRQVVVDSTGLVICMYDKIHLCDYGDCAETRYFEPGDR